jgi:hypothetical protein
VCGAPERGAFASLTGGSEPLTEKPMLELLLFDEGDEHAAKMRAAHRAQSVGLIIARLARNFPNTQAGETREVAADAI